MSILSKIQIIQLKKIRDNRGFFLKVINSIHLNHNFSELEVYITNCVPGETRGGHYHIVAKEWFFLLSGKCILKLQDIQTNETFSLELTGDDENLIYIPPNIAHEFVNVSETENFSLLAVTDKYYRPEDTIPYS